MLFYTKTQKEVFSEVNGNENGLSESEASLRLKKFGENVLKKEKKNNLFLKFLAQFKDIMVIILLVSAIISLVFSIVKKSSTELIDAIIIFVIVLINAILGFSQEVKAENALESLKKMSQPYATVVRDGKMQKVETKNLVVGDIVLLETGDVVPADVFLFESFSLKCDESSLTGESLAVEKQSGVVLKEKTSLGDRKNMCFSSTIVMSGRGKGIVVATGKDAEIGKIASLIQQERQETTPLQNSLNKLGEIITFIVLFIAIVIFLIDIIFAHLGFIESFLTAVAIAVAAIPESLPAVVTIILSLGVVRLAKKNAIIKKLHAVETLGCCEVICSDKTGTITQNKMTVQEVVTLSSKTSLNLKNFHHLSLIRCMVLCNNANVDSSFGDSTELALLNYAKKYNVEKANFDTLYPKLAELPFDSTRKLMSTLHNVNGVSTQFTKGAIDSLLLKCEYVLENNKMRKITQKDKERILLENKKMCEKAERVLAFATKVADENNRKIEENQLVFLGLAGMIDPPRDEVFDALKKCRSAGMKAVMITGDHKETATAIAFKLGMIKSEKEVVQGSFLDKFSDDELAKEIHKYTVFTRVTPEHKVRIVKAFQKSGKIVAMTGDGVNDAPSIKVADIGIGMGKSGTDVTRDVANMILSDDNFATIVLAVEEGRQIFKNIQKTIQFLLSCNIAEVLAIFFLTLFYPTHPFLSAVQILFINLITDTFPSIALGVDKKEKDLMLSPPRNPKKNIIGGETGFSIVYQGLAQAILVIATYMIGFYVYSSQEIASTMSFLTLNFIQLFHMYNVHSPKSIFRESAFKNKMINFAFLFEISIFVVISFVPFLSNVLNMAKLTVNQWLIVFLTSFAIIPICEIVKIFMTPKK